MILTSYLHEELEEYNLGSTFSNYIQSIGGLENLWESNTTHDIISYIFKNTEQNKIFDDFERMKI